MPSIGKFVGETARALGKLIAERVARQEERTAAESVLRSLAARAAPPAERVTGEVFAGAPVQGRIGDLVEVTGEPAGSRSGVGTSYKSGGGLTRRDIVDLLREYYADSLRASPGEYIEHPAEPPAEQVRALDELKRHMPVSVAIPRWLPSERPGDVEEAVETLAVWLSTLSRMPKELFKRAGRVQFYSGYPAGLSRGAGGGFYPYPEGDPRRRIAVPGISEWRPEWAEFIAPWTLAHEAGHSLQYSPNLYDRVLDFLESTQWRFPTTRRGELPAGSGFRGPLLEWVPGREHAPKTYEELRMMFRPFWPAQGRPLRPPPGVWTKTFAPGSARSITYAEKHPVEDIAESTAARVLESYPELLADISDDAYRSEVREWVQALKRNVRYEPITEFLKASGVPLAWLLYLLQRRHGQEEVKGFYS